MGGTTSACAENTTALSEGEHRIGNYLRVRGEYQLAAGSSIRLEELPPRARRIPVGGGVVDSVGGTTSACAENTYRGHQNDQNEGNYLRVRGEYSIACGATKISLELPPRARRIRLMRRSCPHPRGTTSACAENTPRFRHCYVLSRNYLRVRGEYFTSSSP